MKYAGSFMKGLSGGISTGFSMVMNVQELKWKKAEQKQLEKDKEAYKEAIGMFKSNNEDLFEGLDTQGMGEGTGLNLITNAFAVSEDFGKAIKDYALAINSGNRAAAEQAHEEAQLITEYMLKLQLGGGELAENWTVENFVSEESKKWIRARDAYKATPTATMPYEMTKQVGEMAGLTMPETMPEAPKLTDTQVKLAEIDKLTFLSEERRNKMKVQLLVKDSTWAEKVKDARAAGATDEDIVKMAGGGVIGPEPTTTTLIPFKTLEAVKDSFKNIKDKAGYDSALQSYNASKEAKASGWTPPPFETLITDLIKKVETAIWADYVKKDGKLKDKGEAEDYNTHLQYYLNLIEEAKNAGINVDQFQTFIPYKEIYWGVGNPLVIAESW